MSNIIGNVLIDKDDTNVVSLGERAKGFFDLCQCGVLLDNQKVGSLGISMSNTSQQEPSDSVLAVKQERERER